MARTQITLRDTFNLWRTKSNEALASMGDLGTLVATKEVSFANPLYKNPDFFTGTDAQILVTKKDVYSVNVTDAGDGYSEGDTLFIKGSELGGTDDVNDLTITIDSVGPSGEIGDVSTSGTPAAELILEVNQLRDEVGDAGTLTTTAQTVYGAINELDAVQGDVLATEWGTDAATLTGAIKELKANLGDVTADDLGTDASTIVTAIAEIASEIGDLDLSTATGVNLGSDLTSAVNALKVQADDLQTELGGDMVDDYDGTQSTVIAALNSLYAASSISTLDAEYIRRDGTTAMIANTTLKVSNSGISINTKGDALVFKTWNADQDALVNRLTIADSTGNIGVGTSPSASYRMNVDGKLKATNLYYGTQDTDNRYLRLEPGGGTGDITANLNLKGNVEVNPIDVGTSLPDPDKTFTVHGITIADSTSTGDSFTPLDWVRDTVTSYLTSTDITFNSTNGGTNLDLVVQDNSHNHTSTNISDFNEAVEDVIGAMLANPNIVGHGDQKGIDVTYDDNVGSRGFINFNVHDFTVDVGRTAVERGNSDPGSVGDVVGSFTINDLGSIEEVELNVRDEKIRDVAASILTAGTGISVISDDNADTVTFANTDLGSSQNIFKDISFATQEEGSITYFNVDPTSANGTTGARFNVTRTGNTSGSTYAVEMIATGTEYITSETLTIDGSLLGGTSPANDLLITVSGLNNTFQDDGITKGEIATYSVVDPNVGAPFFSTTISSLQAATNTDSITYLESDGIDIQVDDTNNKVTFNVVREYVEDVVGAMFDNNFATGIDVQYYDTKTTPPTNRGKIGLTAQGLNAGDIRLTGDVTGQLTQGSTSFEINTSINTGAVGIDEIKGFDEQVRDVVKNYLDVSHSGSGLTSEIIDALDEKFFAFDGDDVIDLDSSPGSGASINITKVSSSYTGAVDDRGSGYSVGQRFVIAGTELDGDNTNDATVSITGVDSTGGVTAVAISGVAKVTTNTVDKYRLTVDINPSVTIGDGDTVSVANSDISGTGTTGTAFGLKIKTGAVGATELATNAVTTAKIKNGAVTRAKTSANVKLEIQNSSGNALKTIYGWSS